ncbi:AAA-like domain-containing protein, partial [Microcoleus sp. Pol7_A1]|uniref:AAA-like domain-containing protein n=1 Tax=Microcoleus sp. Pol7_A1 TaxID=2818893 RepID=UPI002FD2F31C
IFKNGLWKFSLNPHSCWIIFFVEVSKSGCVSISMAGIPEELTPVLKKKSDFADLETAELAIFPAIDNILEESSSAVANAQSLVSPAVSLSNLDNPEGSVSFDSPLYIDRPPIESDCYQTIAKPGALIRVKSPRKMGKTSLLQRILYYSREQGHQTAYLNFQSADGNFISNLDQLLQWLCVDITNQLNLEDRVADYWKQGMGSKQKCGNYFQRYLLATITTPLTLGLDEVDRVFQYPQVAQEFFGLLRAWHEKGKNEPAWKKLRLVISHSKEVYIPLNINQSPFNVGLSIELPEFNHQQIVELVQKHQLNWSASQIEQLIGMVDGHPYLLRKALYEIARGCLTLEEFLQSAPTEEGIYGDHLRHHLIHLTADPNLEAAMKQVIASSVPVRLEAELAFKLRSRGLVKLRGNDVIPLCNLCRLYFKDRLGVH